MDSGKTYDELKKIEKDAVDPLLYIDDIKLRKRLNDEKWKPFKENKREKYKHIKGRVR